uniref:Uncharacterized protein n=1 Tax=Daucus carota subsp. sativus TaxID=79200 RepID=A0A161ZXZ0_DAUCS
MKSTPKTSFFSISFKFLQNCIRHSDTNTKAESSSVAEPLKPKFQDYIQKLKTNKT